MPRGIPNKPRETATFRSIGANFLIFQRPPREKLVDGGWREVDNGIRHDFSVNTPGGPGTYITSDPEAIEFLRNLESNGSEFVEVGREPDAIHPSLQELLPQIVQASARGDLDALGELRAAEEQTHRRVEVLSAIDGAFEEIETRTAPAT